MPKTGLVNLKLFHDQPKGMRVVFGIPLGAPCHLLLKMSCSCKSMKMLIKYLGSIYHTFAIEDECASNTVSFVEAPTKPKIQII